MLITDIHLIRETKEYIVNSIWLFQDTLIISVKFPSFGWMQQDLTIESDKTTSLYNVSTRVLSKK